MTHSQTSGAEVAVELSGVHKAFRNGSTVTPVLNDVNLKIGCGQCTFFVGPSGSGKTTLLSIIGCLLAPDGGLAKVLGHDIARLAPPDRARLRLLHLGFVFQRFHLIRGLTVLENCCVPMTLAGLPVREARQRAHGLLNELGLAEKAKLHPHKLSTGQCQRVAIARALANDPDLILADEPTAALDADSGLRAMELLRSLASDKQKTLIVVTHDARIFSFADCLHSLENGRLVASAKPEKTPTQTVAPLCIELSPEPYLAGVTDVRT